jgi:hypothetical protein
MKFPKPKDKPPESALNERCSASAAGATGGVEDDELLHALTMFGLAGTNSKPRSDAELRPSTFLKSGSKRQTLKAEILKC